MEHKGPLDNSERMKGDELCSFRLDSKHDCGMNCSFDRSQGDTNAMCQHNKQSVEIHANDTQHAPRRLSPLCMCAGSTHTCRCLRFTCSTIRRVLALSVCHPQLPAHQRRFICAHIIIKTKHIVRKNNNEDALLFTLRTLLPARSSGAKLSATQFMYSL